MSEEGYGGEAFGTVELSEFIIFDWDGRRIFCLDTVTIWGVRVLWPAGLNRFVKVSCQ